MQNNKTRKIEYEYSIGFRVVHWLRALCIVILILTGLYIAYVFQAPEVSSEPVLFMQAKYRFVHLIFGFVLIATFIFKTYLFLFDKVSLKERVSLLDFLNPVIWYKQIKYYLFLGEHPKLRGTYNPLQFGAYIVFYILFFLICLTGLTLYIHVFHDGLGGALYNLLRPVEVSLGGLSNVRALHHICMNIIIIFVPFHVYMVIFNSIKGKEATADSIVSGYKFSKEHN